MIRPSVTLSLVPEARGGPFVFWNELASSCAQAAALGFEAVEIFPPAAQALTQPALAHTLSANGLALAAVGTGAGWLLHRLHLVHPDTSIRQGARAFIGEMIEAAAAFGAPVIVGSMQGRAQDGVTPAQARHWLREGLEELGERARNYRLPLLLEPLNRYETNLINSQADALQLLESVSSPNIRLLADLFHMNIEERSIPQALRAGASRLGHLHFVDSNRRPAGQGHLDFHSVAQALQEIGYQGYASAEALPYPDSLAAARQTIETFRRYFA